MAGSTIKHTALGLVFGTLLTGSGIAQNAPPASAPPVSQTQQANANETREQLRMLLQQFPPDLGDVLRLDHSLLTNKEFLTPYPRLDAFLVQHPEVLRDPSYYVGQGGQRFNQPRSSNEVAANMVEGLSIFLVIGTIVGALGWIVRSIIDHRRWLRMSKVQHDVHAKILDRFTGSADLLAYIQTSAGKRFLESAPISLDSGSQVSAPLGRILTSIQIGMVLGSGGVGMFFASRRFDQDVAGPFFVLGILGIALGVGFVLSALVSYGISRSMGLVTPSTAQE
jgi:hypothetical protein